MKRFLLLFIALVMIVSLCACDEPQTEEPTDTTDGATPPEEETTSDAPEQILDIIADGASEYRIVCSETASEAVSSAALSMRNVIRNVTGVELKVTSDLSTLTEGGDISQKKEILVGRTDYDESKSVLSECAYGDYVIRVCGNKIVIISYDEAVLSKACTHFADLALKHGTRGSFSAFASDINATRTVTKTVSALPRFEGTGEVQILDSADDAYMLLVEKSNKNAFGEYLQKIADAGYTLYTTHSATGNDFYTYVNDDYTIQVYYRLYDRSIRAIAEPRGLLPLTEPEQYETVTTPSVTMLGLEIDGNQIGLCLIFRLSNGHFLILDGGNNKKVYADRIYAKLQELAVDKNNIVIDAWFISHGHTDHAGGMVQFAKNYAKSVTVKQFICNIPPDAKLLEIDDLTFENTARNAMKTFPNITITKAHTGQIFYFADAKIEMLLTAEDIYPRTFGDANSASIVFRVTLGGQTIMCLGDEYTDCSSTLVSMYTNRYLKSDFVQVSHHGLNGATGALYNQIVPDTALWPGGLQNYNEKLKTRDYNKTLLSIIKDFYIAGSTDVTISLPYTVQNNKAANG